jgi:dCMP deaminase
MPQYIRRVESVTGGGSIPIYDWDISYMKSALLFAEHSKCAAKQVACLLVKDGGIISIGINGTSPGAPNCCDIFHKMPGGQSTDSTHVHEPLWHKYIDDEQSPTGKSLVVCKDQREHYKWSLLNEIHAEANAIGKCARQGISTKGAVAYITHSPCHDCAKTLAVSGIDTVYFNQDFDNVEEVANVLNKGTHQIRMYKLEV